MNNKKDYTRDLAEIRTMMERTSRLHSLSVWAGSMAGIYALLGAYIAYAVFDFNPDGIFYSSGTLSPTLFIAVIILFLTLGTAWFLSHKKAAKRKESLWNPITRNLLVNMGVPLGVGGLLIIILLAKGLIGLVAPFSLLFYGMAIYNASKFTYEDFKLLGALEIGLGLISSYFVEYGLMFWALGFGFIHIIYGVFMYFKYEK